MKVHMVFHEEAGSLKEGWRDKDKGIICKYYYRTDCD
jgi:hypothetical protein